VLAIEYLAMSAVELGETGGTSGFIHPDGTRDQARRLPANRRERAAVAMPDDEAAMSGKKDRSAFVAELEQAVEAARATRRHEQGDAYDEIMTELRQGARLERANRPLAMQVREAAAPFVAWMRRSGLQEIAPIAWAKAPIVTLHFFQSPSGEEVPLSFVWYCGDMSLELSFLDAPLEAQERWLLEELLAYFLSEEPWDDVRAFVERRTKKA
jgi:hypothetical protein